MKFNKNIFAYAICMAMFAPLACSQDINNDIATGEVVIAPDDNSSEQNFSNDESELITEALIEEENAENIEIAQEIVAELILENANEIIIDALQGSIIINNFTQNDLIDGSSFTINRKSFTLDSKRTMTPAEEEMIQSIIEAIGSNVIEAIITTINADITNNSTAQSISQAAAVALLQKLSANLVVGSSFTLNGIHYTVTAQN